MLIPVGVSSAQRSSQCPCFVSYGDIWLPLYEREWEDVFFSFMFSLRYKASTWEDVYKINCVTHKKNICFTYCFQNAHLNNVAQQVLSQCVQVCICAERLEVNVRHLLYFSPTYSYILVISLAFSDQASSPALTNLFFKTETVTEPRVWGVCCSDWPSAPDIYLSLFYCTGVIDTLWFLLLRWGTKTQNFMLTLHLFIQ